MDFDEAGNFESDEDLQFEETSSPELEISRNEADHNYELAGTEVEEPPDVISSAKYQHLLLNDSVHQKILEVLDENQIPFILADFQMISLHVLGNLKNLILISPPGNGKMLVVLLGTLLMRKILCKKRGVSVGTQPLSMIMEEKRTNKLVQTAVVTMSGSIRGNSDESCRSELSSPEAEVLGGDYPVLIGHPESWASSGGQDLLRKLQKNEMITLNFVDELHQGLENHWNAFRPEMKTVTGRLRIFSVSGAPTIAMSATVTDSEVKAIIENLGLRAEPVILRASPIQDHVKYVTVKRPSNICGLDGFEDKHGKEKPGLICLLNRIYLSKYIENLKLNLPVKKCIVLFRTDNQMLGVYDYVRQQLPQFKGSQKIVAATLRA